MEMYIHYKSLPEGKDLHDVLGELDEVLEDVGAVCGGEAGRIDLDLEDERAYLQRAQFPRDTTVEIGGMEIGVYE